MTRNNCLAFLLVGLFAACKNQTHETKENILQPKTPLDVCYNYVKNNDTIALSIKNEAGAVSGTLRYSLYQKDRNTGFIEGNMNEDLLVADYTFAAEGKQSVRQVVFKKVGDHFIEGYGEVVDQNGNIVFKNINSLSFDTTFKLVRVACK